MRTASRTISSSPGTSSRPPTSPTRATTSPRLPAPADDPHFAGQAYSVPFQISEYAAFSDVDASAWYADAVYNAADLGYMTGISGTDLFMPMADITRAELAKVFANMAGKAFSPDLHPDQVRRRRPAGLVRRRRGVGRRGRHRDGLRRRDLRPGRQGHPRAGRRHALPLRQGPGQGRDRGRRRGTLAAYKDGDQVSDWARTCHGLGRRQRRVRPGAPTSCGRSRTSSAPRWPTIAVRFQPEALPEA